MTGFKFHFPCSLVTDVSDLAFRAGGYSSPPERDENSLKAWTRWSRPSPVALISDTAAGREPQLHPGHVASWSQNAPRPRREQSRGFLAAFPVAQGSSPLRSSRKRPAAVPPDVRVPASGVSPCGPSRARRPFEVAVPCLRSAHCHRGGRGRRRHVCGPRGHV